MAASPNIVSHGDPMQLTQSEATAAQRTWPFYLSNSADGTPATGKTISGADFKISKAGGAFGNAVGTVTEMSLGWYKMVFDVGDLDTLGALACELSVEAGVDTLHVVHQVIAADLNVALAPTTDLAAVATNVSDIKAATPALRHTGPHAMGTRTTNGSFTALSMAHAYDAEITVTGTWNGGTVTIETCADVTAVSPVWTTYDDGAGPNPLTANGTVTVDGPVSGVRATLSGAGGATSLVAVATMRAPL